MAPDPRPTFGEQLRHWREAAGLSQEKLAERSGLTAKAISALERGDRQQPRLDTIKRLAEALDLSPEQQATLQAAVPRRRGESAWASPAHFPVCPCSPHHSLGVHWMSRRSEGGLSGPRCAC